MRLMVMSDLHLSKKPWQVRDLRLPGLAGLAAGSTALPIPPRKALQAVWSRTKRETTFTSTTAVSAPPPC